ncbi:hypothetical protein [Aquimarina brevivitae]|uniref:Uncharacterized protein n=1 Tax=Aquimarina brevivitae TaxID=323412 RepID=A0A4Q7NU65_9FLAO|nr:hypothetical protein [Aquimarina brevivitae]RZS90635.1 hypothetical protein EV197_3164 [Aquimarina brevivitae]
MKIIAQYCVILFGLFLISVGILMLVNPSKARYYLRKAASTAFINYAEITIRMLPAGALIISAEIAKYPIVFQVLGWFMLATSLVLYTVPRKMHHQYALKSADILKPLWVRVLSPIPILFGVFLGYAVLTL